MGRGSNFKIYYRLGEESAKAYSECPVDHWSKKNQNTVEEKAALATEYTKKFENTAMLLIVKIYCTYDVAMMTRFLNALHFINNFFRKFAQEYFPNVIYPQNIIKKRSIYYPRLLDMYQHDCHALLSDIMGFGKRVKMYLRSCKNAVKLNKYIHMAHTVTFYLEHVKRNNPAFWDKQPQHVRKITIHK